MASSDSLAASLPIDPHSYASISPVRVRHLALDLTVDFDQHTLAGTATWHLANPGTAAEVALDTHDLTIEAVEALQATGHITPTSFTLDAPDVVLGQALRVALPPAGYHGCAHSLPHGPDCGGTAMAGPGANGRPATLSLHAVAGHPGAYLAAMPRLARHPLHL